MTDQSSFCITSGDLARRLHCCINTAHRTAARMGIRAQRLPNGWTLFHADDVEKATRAISKGPKPSRKEAQAVR